MAVSSASLSYQLVCLVIILGVFGSATAVQSTNSKYPNIPDGYVVNENLNVAFKVHLEKRTWAEAKRLCEAENAILALVNDMEQINYLKDLKPFNTYVWVGMSRKNTAAPWATVRNDTPMTDIPWAPTKPDGPHNCMAIRGCNKGLTNENCLTLYGFICEMARGILRAI